ncbi:unnamed protein product [Larinioides sclopetarius]|uniref:BPTI/Kunitz inhibitor domain-containing protein n=1 Tax=Larinioides sclopetarius TaxID=280406 RepID=A0AAV2AP95_9ARAC
MCRAYIIKYHYNPSRKDCFTFVWGGCGGNGNNFETYEECMATCKGVCYLPEEVGRCRASFTRYHYDPSRKDCFTFIWGGCGGNGNNFESYDDCMAACKGA